MTQQLNPSTHQTTLKLRLFLTALADNTLVNNEVQKVTNNINNSTDNTPVILNRDQNITNHLTQKQNVDLINVISESIDNSITNSTNNPASVWNHALSPKVRESTVPGGRTNSDCILILQN